ncbi:divalent metal cation transporter [Paenibacillus sp. chi10]|uniref:Divalent metal cation transporter n=1 Tax=Paenibacillus suaedae TaxID=3077233 RepID=A0AAJ2JWY3_9BACL|nr:divalent metal cation transporter [Paenibacillus sp. chi10]MDT8975819.1 divalent metal cation transporter [Paenibacillus sp. chi10]
MIFFQGSAIIDKGITAKDLRLARIDTIIGSVCQVFIAICCILIGASLFGQAEILNEDNPSTIIMALHDLFGPWASSLFGFGLFNAGFLAAITISLSSSWTFAEAFNWKHSLITNNKKYMGEYKNSLFTNIWGWMVVGVLTSLIVMLFYETFWT